MQIFLQSNTTHTFDVNGCETVQDAKNFISQAENIECAEVSIILIWIYLIIDNIVFNHHSLSSENKIISNCPKTELSAYKKMYKTLHSILIKILC